MAWYPGRQNCFVVCRTPRNRGRAFVTPTMFPFANPLLRLVLLVCLALGAAAPGLAAPAVGPVERILSPIDTRVRTELAGHLHPALRQATDRGAAAAALPLNRLILVLQGSAAQEAALEQFLHDVQDPQHPDYQHWLTPQTFAQRYGVHPADLARVQTWLRAQGFTIDALPAGGRSIQFSGTVAQLDRAFGTHMHHYDWHGERHLATASNPTIPTALAGVVRGFASLHDFRHQPQVVRLATGVPGATGTASAPQLNATNGNHYLGPGDYAVIYDLSASYAAGLNGAGHSIAVLGRTDIVAGDLSTYRNTFGLGANAPLITYNGKNPGIVSGDELESDLDLEWSGGVAPGATIQFITSPNTGNTDGIDLSAQYAVSNNVADIISVSYGSCESPTEVAGGAVPFYHQLWQQAAAQGISVLVSSGDAGAADCDPANASTAVAGLGVNRLCSSPYSTCVGGTQFTADVATPATYWAANNAPSLATALSYIGEGVWNESGSNGGSGLYSSGGGASLYFAKPSWQYAVGVPSDGLRDVPDLALTAAQHDGYWVYTSDVSTKTTTSVSVGGTSASTPAMAGIVALIAQKQGKRLGNINAVLYGLSNLQASGGASVFHRITSGNNSVPGQPGFSASSQDPSYNQATGLGSVDAGLLIAHWTDAAASIATLSPSAALVPAAATQGALTLNLGAAVAWTASSNSAWLGLLETGNANGSVTGSIASTASGTGPASLTFAAQANSGAARTGTITINGLTLTVTQAAATTPVGGQIVLSPASLTFGSAAVGGASAPQRLTVGNSGAGSLTLGSIALAGSNPGDYASSGSCAAGLILTPGASCYLDLSFRPTAVGSRPASLLVGNSSVSLSGTGTAAVADSAASADVPLPLWAYALLALGLAGALLRRRAPR